MNKLPTFDNLYKDANEKLAKYGIRMTEEKFDQALTLFQMLGWIKLESKQS